MTKRKVVQPDLIDLLLADYQKPEDLLGENGILKQLTKAIVERALQAELFAHLGHDSMLPLPTTPATHATAAVPRHSRAISAPCPLRSRVTAMAASSRSSLPNTRPAGPASMTRFCRFTHGA